MLTTTAWNIDLLYRRMTDKAEQHRVFLAFVEPAYSSALLVVMRMTLTTTQTCNSCRAIDKKSRNGEVFKASMNILQRFLDGEFTVSRGIQRA